MVLEAVQVEGFACFIIQGCGRGFRTECFRIDEYYQI